MATRMLRRGLPRVIGGEPWPPAGDVEVADAAGSGSDVDAGPVDAAPVEVRAPAPAIEPAAEPVDASGAAARSAHHGASGGQKGDAAAAGSVLRRGLPRTPGGEPWPPADATARTAATAASSISAVAEPVAASARAEPVASPVVAATATSSAAPDRPQASSDGTALRRGLPRTPRAEPWPPAGTRVAATTAAAAVSHPSTSSGSEAAATETAEETAVAASVSAAPSTTLAPVDVSSPLLFQRTVFAGKNAFTRPAPAPEPKRIGPFTKAQWAGVVIVGGIGLLGAAAMAVFFVRWLLSLSGMQDFLQTYPGEYHLPEGAPVGFPGWLGWQHFFNVFLMVLIIRSGLSVRHDKRPTAFWTARGNKKSKISLTLWFHQSLDILWLINGIVFVVLLFATGQWMRVIPTSWDVFPNALSAALQYVSLDWPTENGWVNYNSLQQLAYGTTIFIAAPLAAITGARMSGIWPKNAARLNKAYPVEWARALHFPVMLYFVVFIAIHVFLVFATGALRNLNHMYAAQGSVDPNAYADNWTGFWFLVASLVVIAAAWVAARPMVLAPIAKLFGNVSAR
ncbi:cytochrome b/b6 domain-containing protein [Microbacterium sp. TWP3-1-2b2]|uniref:cytochrome b/b6 domain-containing protein n=1 Tax=Microbacterium sp. TWP3-1-2b2 TaxID=2804651 RepID=UPI003CF655CA